jgi:hypothetical protein
MIRTLLEPVRIASHYSSAALRIQVLGSWSSPLFDGVFALPRSLIQRRVRPGPGLLLPQRFQGGSISQRPMRTLSVGHVAIPIYYDLSFSSTPENLHVETLVTELPLKTLPWRAL